MAIPAMYPVLLLLLGSAGRGEMTASVEEDDEVLETVVDDEVLEMVENMVSEEVDSEETAPVTEGSCRITVPTPCERSTVA